MTDYISLLSDEIHPVELNVDKKPTEGELQEVIVVADSYASMEWEVHFQNFVMTDLEVSGNTNDKLHLQDIWLKFRNYYNRNFMENRPLSKIIVKNDYMREHALHVVKTAFQGVICLTERLFIDGSSERFVFIGLKWKEDENVLRDKNVYSNMSETEFRDKIMMVLSQYRSEVYRLRDIYKKSDERFAEGIRNVTSNIDMRVNGHTRLANMSTCIILSFGLAMFIMILYLMEKV